MLLVRPPFLLYQNVNSNITLSSGFSYHIDTSASRTLTLPTAGPNLYFWIKDSTGTANTNNITIARVGSESIDGLASNKVLSTNFGGWFFVCDGTNWFITSNNAHTTISIFNSSGTWTAPAGITSVKLYLRPGAGGGGGGGAGGAGFGSITTGGGGGSGRSGGAGGSARFINVRATVIPGTNYSITIGAGGTGGTGGIGSAGTAGGNGGASSFGSIVISGKGNPAIGGGLGNGGAVGGAGQLNSAGAGGNGTVGTQGTTYALGDQSPGVSGIVGVAGSGSGNAVFGTPSIALIDALYGRGASSIGTAGGGGSGFLGNGLYGGGGGGSGGSTSAWADPSIYTSPSPSGGGGGRGGNGGVSSSSVAGSAGANGVDGQAGVGGQGGGGGGSGGGGGGGNPTGGAGGNGGAGGVGSDGCIIIEWVE